jgi:hypothetical protein
MQDCERHGGRVFKEGSKEPDCYELQGESKAAAIAPLIGDAFSVIVIEMEVSRQFVGRQRVGITAITPTLRGGQKIDGHRVSPITITRNATASAVRKNEGFVELKQTAANAWRKSLAAVQNTGAMNQSSILLSIVENVRLYRENRLRARKYAGSKS